MHSLGSASSYFNPSRSREARPAGGGARCCVATGDIETDPTDNLRTIANNSTALLDVTTNTQTRDIHPTFYSIAQFTQIGACIPLCSVYIICKECLHLIVVVFTLMCIQPTKAPINPKVSPGNTYTSGVVPNHKAWLNRVNALRNAVIG